MSDRKYEVDIDAANQTKSELADALNTDDGRVMNKLGAFASLYHFNFPEYRDPVLVMKTEEPGSKQLLAFQHDRIEGVCYDMINHLINDCIVMGARPLMIQDAIICGKMEKEKIKRIVKAVSDCCRENGCSLTGGETSEQPGVLSAGTYILTSSIIGIVEKDKIIDGSRIEEGDVVIGIESSGLHTNGYTLVRKLLKENEGLENKKVGGRSFLELVLEPHRCYYNGLKDLFPLEIIRGLAHITGGGIKENLNRILPDDLDAVIDLDSYRILEIFREIKNTGNVTDEEMLRTFNMSVGMTAVTRLKDADEVIGHFGKLGINSYVIGRIKSGNKKVLTEGKLNW
jgi:phosphoribosylformylglycinamidine cyclo-ligase